MIIKFIDGKKKVEYEITKEEEILLKKISKAHYKDHKTGKEYKGIPAFIINFIANYIRRNLDKIVELSGEGSRHTNIKKKYAILEKLIKEENPLLQEEYNEGIPERDNSRRKSNH